MAGCYLHITLYFHINIFEVNTNSKADIMNYKWNWKKYILYTISMLVIVMALGNFMSLYADRDERGAALGYLIIAVIVVAFIWLLRYAIIKHKQKRPPKT